MLWFPSPQLPEELLPMELSLLDKDWMSNPEYSQIRTSLVESALKETEVLVNSVVTLRSQMRDSEEGFTW